MQFENDETSPADSNRLGVTLGAAVAEPLASGTVLGELSVCGT